MHAPSRSSSKEASRIRKRASTRERQKVTRACDECRAKKLKCSGNLPCARCNRISLECRFEKAYLRGNAPAPSPTPGLQSQPQSRDIDGPSGPSSTVDEINNAFAAHSSEPTRRQPMIAQVNTQPKTTFDVRDARDVDPFHRSSRNSPAAADAEGQYLGPASGITFLDRAWRRLGNSRAPKSPRPAAPTGPIFESGDKPLRPDDVSMSDVPSLIKARELVTLYFNVSMVTYRFLHQGSVERWLETMYQQQQQSSSAVSDFRPHLSPCQRSIVLSVLAIAAIHEERDDAISSDRFRADVLYTLSQRELALEEGHPQLESVQARLAQFLFLLTSSRENRAWYLFGTVCNLITAIGLHRRSRHYKGEETSNVHTECCKRTFWSAYILDRYLSAMFGRPKHFQDDDIDQQYPLAIDDEQLEPPNLNPLDESYGDRKIDALIHHAKLGRIYGNILKDVYSIKVLPESERIAAARQMDTALDEWHANLPTHLGKVHPSSLIQVFRRQCYALKLSHAHAVVQSNRPFLLGSFANTGRTSLQQGQCEERIDKCISAATEIMKLVIITSRQSQHFQAFWFTHYVAFCALVVVYVYIIQKRRAQSHQGSAFATINDEEETLFQLAGECQEHIALATEKNSPSRRYSIILEELCHEVRRRTRLGNRPNNEIRPNNPGAEVSVRHTRDDLDGIQPIIAPDMDLDGFGQSVAFGTSPYSDPDLFLLDRWEVADWSNLDAWPYGNLPDFGQMDAVNLEFD